MGIILPYLIQLKVKSNLVSNQKNIGSLFGDSFGGLNCKHPEMPLIAEVEIDLTLEELFFGCKKNVEYVKDTLQFSSVLKRKTSIEVEIKPGYGTKNHLVFKGKGNDSYYYPTSDLIIHIKEKPHAYFRRLENDLYFTHHLKLVDAICPEQIEIKTIDKRVLSIPIERIVSSKFQKRIKGEGMPIYQEETYSQQTELTKGDLIIDFEIEFPKFIPENVKQVLNSVL